MNKLSLTMIFCFSLAYFTQTRAEESYDQISQFFSDTRTMTARFKQRLSTDDGEVLQTSTGKFYLQRPGRFRWSYDEPYKQEIISDGLLIWIYDVDLQQVTVQKQGVALSNTPMALIQDKTTIEQAFEVVSLESVEGIDLYTLMAKEDQTDFKEIKLGLRDGKLIKMIMRDQFDQQSVISFSKTETNAPIPPSVFTFKAPDGVDIYSNQ